jgi:uncharacterized membrane-anchored protein YjiN (DUF445 family)
MKPFIIILALVIAALPFAVLRAYLPALSDALGIGALFSAILVGALADFINVTNESIQS